MGAKIAKVGPPRFSGVRCQEIDVSFPQLYRVTSYEWQMINGELISSDMPAPTAYILEEPAHWRVHARPTITAINAPEADKDFGWIIVRHHHSAELAEGYAAAMWDLEHALLPFNELHCPVYEVRGQFFTLLHRPPIEGRASPAIMYLAKVPHDLVGWDEWGRAVGESGAGLSVEDLFAE